MCPCKVKSRLILRNPPGILKSQLVRSLLVSGPKFHVLRLVAWAQLSAVSAPGFCSGFLEVLFMHRRFRPVCCSSPGHARHGLFYRALLVKRSLRIFMCSKLNFIFGIVNLSLRSSRAAEEKHAKAWHEVVDANDQPLACHIFR